MKQEESNHEYENYEYYESSNNLDLNIENEKKLINEINIFFL